jgi:hypothetical protein
MADEVEDLIRAREAARRYATATREMAEFLARTSAVPDPAREAEYATILARELEARDERQEALHDLGLFVPSLEQPEEA